jgi:hypothetical protein
MRWRCRNSARANREHCTPNYYRATKKTAFSLNEACMTPPRHKFLCVGERERRAAAISPCAAMTAALRIFRTLRKRRFYRGFCRFARCVRKAPRTALPLTFRAQMSCGRAPRPMIHHRKIFFHKCGRGGTSSTRFRDESSESVQSDSRAPARVSRFFGLVARRKTKNRMSEIGNADAQTRRRRQSSDFQMPISDYRLPIRRQMPSLRLSSSFTACGLALPPEAFIA